MSCEVSLCVRNTYFMGISLLRAGLATGDAIMLWAVRSHHCQQKYMESVRARTGVEEADTKW